MKNLVFSTLLVSSYWLVFALASGVHDCDLVCPANEVKPVCGSDGKTYQSRCLLRLKKCTSGKKLHVDYNGSCRPPPSCTKERQHVLQRIKNDELIEFGVFIPTCNADGTYSTEQCHKSSASGICWCVDKFGNEVEGTRVYDVKRLDCKSQGRSPRSHPRLPSKEKYARILKGCKKENRISFNKKVLSSFKKEMARLSKKRGQFDFVDIVQWKLNELDRNKDDQLEHKEVKFLIKKLKKAYSPRKCGKTLFYYCDRDHDDMISRKEWFTCLGFQGSDKEYQESTKTSPKPDVSKCAKDYLKASQLQAKDPSPMHFIPSCTKDGAFTSVQCQKLSGYCWCVNTITGRNIPGSSVRNGKPDCTKHALRPTRVTTFKPLKFSLKKTRIVRKQQHVSPKIEKSQRGKKSKECDDQNWNRFSKELGESFRKELEAITKPRTSVKKNATFGSRSLLDDLSQHLPETMILAWKFFQLDTDRDRFVNVGELFVPYMRKTFGRIRRGRKCSRKLTTMCDYDKKRGLSLTEWRSCLRRKLVKTKSPSRPGFLGR